MLITISSHGGPFHLPSFDPFSMYAAFVPVPRITPIAVCGYLYAAASIVPTVSFARAFTSKAIPLLSNWVCSSLTTSSPTQPSAVNSLFQTMSLPELRLSWTVGKEKVKPNAPVGLPPHFVARKVATESAKKPKRPSASDSLISLGILNLP